jgi:hypothetical protein
MSTTCYCFVTISDDHPQEGVRWPQNGCGRRGVSQPDWSKQPDCRTDRRTRRHANDCVVLFSHCLIASDHAGQVTWDRIVQCLALAIAKDTRTTTGASLARVQESLMIVKKCVEKDMRCVPFSSTFFFFFFRLYWPFLINISPGLKVTKIEALYQLILDIFFFLEESGWHVEIATYCINILKGLDFSFISSLHLWFIR